jgi:TatA/E family protein of Tat protein translocase
MPFPNIGAPELILILVIALIVLGPGKLPEVASSLGRSVREFRKAATDVKDAASLEPTPSSQAQTGQAQASTQPSTPPANELHGSSEPNRLTEPTAAEPTAAPAPPSGDQQPGSASS